MSFQVAAQMANQINNRLTDLDLDENLMIAIALTKKGNPVRSAIELFRPGEENAAAATVIEKAQDCGYSEVSVKTEIYNWYNLDWQKLPWIIPNAQDLDDWLDLNQWERIASEAGLDPAKHIRETDSDYHSDKVSLKLWNIRMEGAANG